jgi:nicotinamidase-related amidase
MIADAEKRADDLAEKVRRARLAPPALLAETRSALVLVDVTNRFIIGADEANPASTVSVLKPIELLLAAARTAGVPRIYVTVGHAGSWSDSAASLRRLADMGSDVESRLKKSSASAWLSEIPPAIAPRPDEPRLTKWRPSAFYETGLETLLRGAGVETIVLVGVASYGCIIATYLDACSRSFLTLLCAEGIDGARASLHRAALEVMGEASRIGTADVIRVWSSRS